MTLEQLRLIMPRCSPTRAVNCLPALELAMAEAEISTPLRQAAFLAQLAHESSELKFFEELASGAAYDLVFDPHLAARLGNTQPGDGRRFKGRGPIQLTGRANYRAAGEALHLPLLEKPEMVATVDVGFRVAGWFWKSRGLNALADAGDFDAITKRINGGLNGKAQRDRYYQVAKDVLVPPARVA